MIAFKHSARWRSYGVAVLFTVPATALSAALPVIGSHHLVITSFLSFLPVEPSGGQEASTPGSAMPDPDSELGLFGLYGLTAVGIALLLAVLYRARLRSEALKVTAGGEQVRREPAARLSPEDARQWNEERFRTPEDQVVNYAIFMLDTLGRSLSWNAGVKRMLGYEKAEFLGASAAELYTPEDRTEGVAERDLAEAAERGRVTAERWLVRKDGTQISRLGIDSQRAEPGRGRRLCREATGSFRGEAGGGGASPE